MREKEKNMAKKNYYAVKQAAKFVAGHNEEDGAAHFLEEWVL